MKHESEVPNILLIVDIQKGFVTECSSHIVAPVNAFQQHFDRVIVTKFHNPDPSPFREILDYLKLPPGSVDTELALAFQREALIIDRPYYTCVTADLRNHLQTLGVREIFVCGIATEACVLKTALDLFECNIRTWLITDLCASDQGTYYHNIALELLAKLIGKEHLITHDEALQRISHKM